MDSIYELQNGKLYEHTRDIPLGVLDYPYNKNKTNKKRIAKLEKNDPFFVLSKIVWIPNAKEERPTNNEENIFTLQVLTSDGTKGFISLHFADLHLFKPST